MRIDPRSPGTAAVFVVVAAVAGGCQRSTPASGIDDAGVVPRPLDCAVDGGDWPMYGQNICNTRSSSDTTLSTANVGRLAVSWKVTTGGDISATPAVVDGQIYVPDWSGMLYRIDATSHSVVWSRSVADVLGLAPAGDGGAAGTRSSSTPAARGTPIVNGNTVIFGNATTSATLFAVDTTTGDLVWQTTLDPHPYAVIASSPAIDQGVLYVGVSSGEEGAGLQDPSYVYTFRGSVAAVDPGTGEVLWQTPMIDDAVFFNADSGIAGYAGAAVWSGTPTIDRRRGQLYVTTGNNYAVPPSQADGGALPAGDRIESIVALDLATGKIRWSQRMTAGDVWTFTMLSNPDYDFGCGANLFQANISGTVHDVVGAGQKSGVYWAVDADTGEVLWHTQVGPGGHLGGIHWGTAVDGERVYVGVNDESGTAYTLGGPAGGERTSVGSWAALDPATGEILWQVANPTMTAPVNGASVNGPVTVVNGVVLVGSMDDMGTMLALDAATGKVLWTYASGATVYGAPAVVDGVVYWGNGYPSRLFFGTPGNTLFAFSVPTSP
jgi:polyvinyl alcohol dehydrogenase (cytochrome)